jgi:cephalosporin-C deacetylase-like acetyl esterase
VAIVGAGFAASLALSVPVSSQQPAPARSAADQAQAQTTSAQSVLTSYLNEIGYAHLVRRAQSVAALRSRAEAERRKAQVRTKILELVGGIPASTGPVVVRRFGTVQESGIRIENIAYQSAPGYWVTANVYVPEGNGPFPAVVIAPGHGAGKSSQFSWAETFARAGVLTLSIDPMGQGERMQHFDAELGVSKIEPSGEHEHANQSALLIGHHVARYWFADGIRGVDYLTERKDVDRNRIGTFGCSGGGTAAAYLAAMDSRIAVAAIASFITSFKELLPGNGPQDAEQTLPSFIASGLDFADWVELAAPRPVAIVAFETDFFPIAGARATYEEARGFYSLYSSADALQLIDGPGGHCNLGPVTPRLLDFLLTHLKGPGTPTPSFTQSRPAVADALDVTPTGQLSTSIGGDTVEELTRRAAKLAISPSKPVSSVSALAQVQKRVRTDVRTMAAVSARPGEAESQVTTTPRRQANGYRLDALTLTSERGIALDGLVAIPDQPGRHPAVLWMDAAPNDRIAESAEFARLAASGHVVLAMHPRGVLGEPPPNPNQLALGPYMPLLLRAIAVGKTLVGMRVDDATRAIDWLVSRSDVDSTSLAVYGTGAQGMVALHAAAIDERITDVIAERTLVSYNMALQAPLHRNLSEVLIPGVLTRYDVADLLMAIAPRPVWLVNPVNAMGQPAREAIVRTELAAALESDANLHRPERIHIVRRNQESGVGIQAWARK